MIKIGQIGIGHNHGEAKMITVKKFPELFEVVGFAEENEEWLEKRGNLECYKGLKRYSVDELIEKCDALLIETDVWNLTEIAQKCIDAGKHVHIDKPASGTLQEYKKMLDTARDKNLIVQLAYMYRYNPAIQKAFQLISEGKLGEIYSINAEMSTFHSPKYREWLTNFGGGIMYILGCHLIDLVVHFEQWVEGKAYDRLGAETDYTEILGVKIPSHTVPVSPGRNLAVIIEAAAINNRQKKMGYNAAAELIRRSEEAVKAMDSSMKG